MTVMGRSFSLERSQLITPHLATAPARSTTSSLTLHMSDGIDTDYAYLDMEFDEESSSCSLMCPLVRTAEEFETDDPYHDLVLL